MAEQKLFNRIEFWILFFFAIRLVGVTNPPIEIGHSWRQVTGLMVSRNFVETDANILYPRVDDNKGETGIIGMEFPVMNYIYFLMAKVFGYTHWYGRLINLIVSSFGLFYFYKVVNKYFGQQHAFISTLCLIGSIWYAFSRKMMPDTFCISLVLVSVFYGTEYLEQGKGKNILLYLLFMAIALLAKIPAGIYLAVFIPVLMQKTDVKRKWFFCAVTIIPLAIMYVWYFIWNPYLSETYSNWYNSGKTLDEGFNDIVTNIGLALEKFYFSAFCSYVFFVCFLAGIVLMIRKKNRTLILPVVTVSIVFIIYIFKSGYFFYHHNYYIIPYVPVMALVAGYAISLVKIRWVFLTLLLAGMVESIANQQHDFFNKSSEKYKLELESIADSISSRRDLIVINGNGNPQQLYLAHRKGWLCDDVQLSDTLFLSEISKKGCKFIFVDKRAHPESLNKEVAFNNQDYTVYKLIGLTGK